MRLAMWMRIGIVLGWNEGAEGIPVPVGHITLGMHSPRVQGTAPVPLSHSAAPLHSLKYPPKAAAASGMSCSALGGAGTGAGPWVLSPSCCSQCWSSIPWLDPPVCPRCSLKGCVAPLIEPHQREGGSLPHQGRVRRDEGCFHQSLWMSNRLGKWQLGRRAMSFVICAPRENS